MSQSRPRLRNITYLRFLKQKDFLLRLPLGVSGNMYRSNLAQGEGRVGKRRASDAPGMYGGKRPRTTEEFPPRPSATAQLAEPTNLSGELDQDFNSGHFDSKIGGADNSVQQPAQFLIFRRLVSSSATILPFCAVGPKSTGPATREAQVSPLYLRPIHPSINTGTESIE